MKRIVMVSDSFKGTLSSKRIGELFGSALEKAHPEIEYLAIPVADGGEGSLEALASFLPGSFVSLPVKGPYLQEMEASYYLGEDKTAYIETASSSGLTLTPNNNPSLSSTYGLGQQILDAISKGAKTIVLALGGSCTNDGGCGLFAALGTKFYDEQGNLIPIPVGKDLIRIHSIDNSKTEALLSSVTLLAMCDVKNPFYGPRGAAYVYAKQKGADEAMIASLDKGLENLASVIEKDLHKDISHIEGSGAAGGLGGGLLAFGNATLKPGIDLVLDLAKFETLLKEDALVISGEGRLDSQSFDGKVISGVAKRCRKHGTPLALIVGCSNYSLEEAKAFEPSIVGLYPLVKEALPFEQIKKESESRYKAAAEELLKAL